MRASRRMAVYKAKETYDIYDYVRYSLYQSTYPSNPEGFGRIITPVTETDVLIQTKIAWLWPNLSRNELTSGMVITKSGGDYGAYGTGVTMYKDGYAPVKSSLRLVTTDDIYYEYGSPTYWMEKETWYPLEIKMSLNAVAGSSNYFKSGTRIVSGVAASGQTDVAGEPWCIFGCTDGCIGDHSHMGSYFGAYYIQRTKFYSYDGNTLIADLLPCMEHGSKTIGMFDTVSNTFCPAERRHYPNQDYFEVGFIGSENWE